MFFAAGEEGVGWWLAGGDPCDVQDVKAARSAAGHPAGFLHSGLSAFQFRSWFLPWKLLGKANREKPRTAHLTHPKC